MRLTLFAFVVVKVALAAFMISVSAEMLEHAETLPSLGRVLRGMISGCGFGGAAFLLWSTYRVLCDEMA